MQLNFKKDDQTMERTEVEMRLKEQKYTQLNFTGFQKKQHEKP
jgi:hypothetical protein